MSLKSFLKTLWQGIQAVWNNLTNETKKDVTLASKVLNEIKEGKLYQDIIELLPQETADKVTAAIKEVAKYVGIVQEVSDVADPNDLIKSIKNIIETQEGLHKNVFLNSLAILITSVLADGVIDWRDLVVLPKWVYDNVINKK